MRNNETLRRVFAVFLCAAMIITYMPSMAIAYAYDADGAAVGTNEDAAAQANEDGAVQDQEVKGSDESETETGAAEETGIEEGEPQGGTSENKQEALTAAQPKKVSPALKAGGSGPTETIVEIYNVQHDLTESSPDRITAKKSNGTTYYFRKTSYTTTFNFYDGGVDKEYAESNGNAGTYSSSNHLISKYIVPVYERYTYGGQPTGEFFVNPPKPQEIDSLKKGYKYGNPRNFVWLSDRNQTPVKLGYLYDLGSSYTGRVLTGYYWPMKYDAEYSGVWVTNAVNNTYIVDEVEEPYTVTYTAETGGSVDPTSQSDTTDSCEAITGSTATPAEGYAFDGWYKGSTLIGKKKGGETLSADLAQGNLNKVDDLYADTEYTAKFAKDDNGDGIPDKYQAKVTFKVVHGAWNDKKTADVVVYVELLNEAGDWDENGTAKLAAADIPAVGNEPDEGYVEGDWDTTPSAGTEVQADTVFTYTYEKEPEPETYTVTYTAETGGGVAPAEQSDTTDSCEAITGSTATPTEGYAFDGWYKGSTLLGKKKGGETLSAALAQGNLNKVDDLYADTEYTAKFAKDDNGDGIPDKYQAKVTFKVVHGAWNDKKTADVVVYVELLNADGDWDENGTAKLDGSKIPAVGNEPEEGYEAGDWDKTPDTDTAIKDGDVFTYTYQKTEEPPVESNAHLTLTKETTSEPADGKAYKLGEKITYKITVDNDGNQTIKDITIVDELPGFQFDTNQQTTGIELAPGEKATATGSYTVTEADIKAGSVVNNATATGVDPDGKDPGVEPGDTDDPTDTPKSHLTLTKETTSEPADGKAYKLGEKITYKITVENDGNQTIKNVEIKDSLEGFTFDEGQQTTGIELVPGEKAIATGSYTVTEADINAGKVVNNATATGVDPNGEDPGVEPGDTDDPTDTPKSHLTLKKETTSTPANGEAYKLGEKITYKITVENDGNQTIKNVEIKDSLEGFTFDEGQKTTGIELAPGEKATATGSYTVTEADIKAGKVHNEATASGDGEPTIVPDDEDNPTDTPKSHLTLKKETTSTPANGEAYKLGEKITYKITVENDGNQTIKNIALVDELEGFVFDEGQKTTIIELAPGEKATATGSYTVTEADIKAGKVHNEATASGDGEPTVVPDDEDNPTEEPNSHLTLTKETTSTPADGKAYKLGEKITYKITVTNDGNQTIKNVEIKDSLEGFTFDEGQKTTGIELAPGEKATATGSYTVTEADIKAGKVHNEATASGDGEPTIVPDDEDNPTDTPKAHLTLKKETTSAPADGKAYKLGEKITYKITVTNDGNQSIKNIAIVDELAGFAFDGGQKTIGIELAPGEKATATGSYTITQADVNKGSVLNVATATGKVPDDDTIVPEVKPGKVEVPTAKDKTQPSGDDEDTSSNGSKSTDKGVKTGDDSGLMGMLEIFGASLTGLLAVIFRRRKHGQAE